MRLRCRLTVDRQKHWKTIKPKLPEIALLRLEEFDRDHSVIVLLKKILLQYGMLAFPFGFI